MHKVSDKIITFLDPKEIEEEALKQITRISKMPFVQGHVAIMPDCHLGKGATVGSVIPTKGAIIPAAVGVDIGCGMIAVKTRFFAKDMPDDLDKLRKGIERRIPLSMGNRNTELTESAAKRVAVLVEQSKERADELDSQKWHLQLGTLGSGNHFIEVCLDETDQVWIVLHSGSRGIGNQLAQRHIAIAQKIMQQNFITLEDKELAYLPESNPAFGEYIKDLLWAQDFAKMNRDEMMDRVLTEFSYTFFGENGHQAEIELERINCHHNFTQKEHHMGHDVWLTRKGAIQMQKGQFGVIPGSMGTRSYIVEGLACIPAYESAPHGAGRRFSRTEARKQFTMEDMTREMKGISYRHDKELLDEIPSAYKSIDHVMENSKELVNIVHELRQIINIKGN